jgi:hypothetical protein
VQYLDFNRRNPCISGSGGEFGAAKPENLFLFSAFKDLKRKLYNIKMLSDGFLKQQYRYKMGEE